MMGRLKSDQGQLFYEFVLNDAVPKDHLVRRIDTALDLSWLRSELAPHYSSMGRPSIDPELMIRMLIVGYVFAIRSERLICREVQVNLAYRWFCKLGIEDAIPDHSAFSRARNERFRQGNVFRQVRAIDVFVDELDLGKLGFGGVEPEATGRPAYHPATLLKIYVYGYLNRVQSSRRLERECQRNIELVWLTGRLMPDFKTIADFRKDNGTAIREVCREFVVLCRRLELFSTASVAIDGSKFKAVNARDRNFTQAKMQRRLAQIDESISRYLSQLDSADRQGEAVPEAKITRLNEKIVALRQEIQRLNGLNTQMMQTEDKQISLTDPDARSMATSGRGSGMVGYNVQSAVDTKHHLISSHEVTNVGSDRSELSRMSEQARAAIGSEAIEAVADRGYYSGEEIVACEQAGITVYLPKPMTSGLYAQGRLGKQDFVYVAEDDVYLFPAGEKLTYHYTNEEEIAIGPLLVRPAH